VTTKTTAERVAALREEYARLGENVDHVSDLDLLNKELERAQAESRRHENNHSSLLQDQVKHDRSVYAAARRSAQGDVTARAGLYLQAILRQSARPINEVVHRASELPANGKAPIQQVRDLKAAADNAKWLLSGMVGDRQNFEDAQRDPEIRLVEKLNAEIRRLREVVLAEGRRLHAGHGHRASGPRCECTGCELIRAMDDIPAEQAPTPSAATAA
jgi:light-regulated signal transduction histidine kinase (bacteriophytochrome)